MGAKWDSHQEDMEEREMSEGGGRKGQKSGKGKRGSGTMAR